ncbi:MAG: hypothetical protein IPK03_03515 [Bacteroidetes bacterium]|nr:hypothetical protein [Bacteroidota bacterium]
MDICGGFQYKGIEQDTVFTPYQRVFNGMIYNLIDTSFIYDQRSKIHAHLAQVALKLKQDVGKRVSLDLALGVNIYTEESAANYRIYLTKGFYEVQSSSGSPNYMINYCTIFTALNIQFHTNSRLYYKGGISYIGPYMNEGSRSGAIGSGNAGSTLSNINLNLGLGWMFKK